MSRFYATCLLPLLLLSGCKKTAPSVTASTPVAPKVASVTTAKVEACSLLTKGEIADVQATEIIDAKSSDSGDGTLLVSQCFYSAKEPSKSVSFTLTQNNPGQSGPAVTAYWKQTFGRFKGGKSPQESESKESKNEGREEAEKERPPQEIAKLGEEAYWSANRFGGALYVLKQSYILRISVGGPGDPPAKLERSKALAQKAIERL